ncbi:MAG: aminopeptidase [Candidatus Eremiobacteraeota bacterium]|nr:aminopeptidase [Candidatus Eremiobacteraeota bacterium]
MHRLLLTLAIVSAISLTATSSSARADSSPDLNAIAKNVTQIAGVKENQIILLTSDPTNFPFLEDLAIQIRAAGAFPLIWVTSDEYNRRMYSEVPAKYDSQSPLLAAGLFKMVDMAINVDFGGDQDYNFFASADQARLAAQAKTFVPIQQAFLSANKRALEIGNGIFPNPPNAALFGVGQAALSQAFWNAMNVDTAKVQANAAKVSAAVTGASTMRVTNPNGTDISFDVKGVHTIVSAGTIQPDCKAANCIISLPAGDIFFIPVAGTANGKIVFDNAFWGKDVLKNLTLMISSGKIVGMTSSSDLTKLKAAYDAGGNGRDQLTLADIGVNDAVKDIPGSAMTASFASGSISFGFGGNLGAGGTNSSPFAFFATQPGSTVAIDGKPLVTNGALALSP